MTFLRAGVVAVGLGLASGGPTLAATSDIRVTAVDGGSSVAGKALQMHEEVQTGQDLETGEGGRCSVLLADAAILQFCNRAKLRIGDGGDPSKLVLNSGELKATVGPRPAGDPLEIHTPAAIATILGTVIHVEVDPDTGDTIVSSLESRVRVRSSNPLVKGSIILNAGERVTIRRGEAPRPKQRFDPQTFARAGSCTFDDDFHNVAARSDRVSQAHNVMEQIAMEDIPVDDLPMVAAEALERSTPAPNPNDERPVFPPICEPGTCQSLPPIPDFGPRSIPVCPGIPGEHCAF
jgi:hypothetical protein